MSIFQLISFLIVMAAVMSFINQKWLHLPSCAGMTLTSMVAAFIIFILAKTDLIAFSNIVNVVHTIHFNQLILHGMLAFLLFSSALSVNLSALKKWIGLIIGLSTVGIFISVLVTGALLWYGLGLLGIQIPFLWTLIFGALIAPTDVVSVNAILEKVKISKDLKIKLVGESLFNDSVSIMLYLLILGFIQNSTQSWTDIPYVFLKELFGGMLIGYILGKITLKALNSINSYTVEIFMTVGLAVGSYALSEIFHVSAPMSTVVAGLIIGNHARNKEMIEITRKNMEIFWEILDKVFNDILFVLIGLEVLVLTFSKEHFLVGLLAVVASLVGRFIGVVVSLVPSRKSLAKGTIPILTWGGLKGGISFALALSLPEYPYKDYIIFATFFAVLVASIGQALSLKWLIKQVVPIEPEVKEDRISEERRKTFRRDS